ncbi:hypothetical protein CWI36_0446p0020 [Hamiltosporidium magnivora]|uniref:SHSP domain-containing protein n=1 Tax=Hamiltosporidium magnivora TaxID=148818 RepID=A0A4Q9LEQ3_9MICR|nr:hypothetical protein CWI36_0446p0020 [Hamiltosporidium magnivora]
MYRVYYKKSTTESIKQIEIMFLIFLIHVFCRDLKLKKYKYELKNIETNKNPVFYYDLPPGIGLENIEFTHDDKSFRIEYGKNLDDNKNGIFESVQGEYTKKVSYRLTNGKISVENGKLKVSFGDQDPENEDTTDNPVP